MKWLEVRRAVKMARQFHDALEGARVCVRPDGSATIIKETSPNSAAVVEGVPLDYAP